MPENTGPMQPAWSIDIGIDTLQQFVLLRCLHVALELLVL